jgi:hypothetical protein
MRQLSFKRYRFPPDIIRHAIWLYGRRPILRRREASVCHALQWKVTGEVRLDSDQSDPSALSRRPLAHGEGPFLSPARRWHMANDQSLPCDASPRSGRARPHRHEAGSKASCDFRFRALNRHRYPTGHVKEIGTVEPSSEPLEQFELCRHF